MTNRLGIEMLTLLGMPPVEHVTLAAELGCVTISTGLMKLPLSPFGYPQLETLYEPWSLLDDAALRRDVKLAMADTGVHIGLGEGFRVAPDLDVADFASQLDVFAELGALRINAISTEPDMDRAIDQFGLLSDMVMARGMRFLVEFAPPHVLNCAEKALAVADALGHERCGMMLDAMHFFRSGGTVEEIVKLPVIYAQMCDAPRMAPEGVTYMQEAMFERMVPGEGELPLREWIAALPDDCEIGLEVPTIARFEAGMSPRDHAAEVVKAARELGA
ncbi:MAG: TIM barrel protein [Novosphingobium sp.]|nr:TIM barrel protein [Novosphingobium sp.]